MLSIINQFSTLLSIITYTDIKQLISSKLQLLNTLQHPHTVSFFKPIDSIIEEKSDNHQSKPIFQQIIKPVEIKPIEIKPLTDQLLTNNTINTTNDINNIDKNISNKRKINEEKTIDENISNKKTKIINNYDFESNKNIENDDSNDEDIPDIIV